MSFGLVFPGGNFLSLIDAAVAKLPALGGLIEHEIVTARDRIYFALQAAVHD